MMAAGMAVDMAGFPEHPDGRRGSRRDGLKTGFVLVLPSGRRERGTPTFEPRVPGSFELPKLGSLGLHIGPFRPPTTRLRA